MGKPSDVRVTATRMYFLPIETRVPYKFGSETLTSITCLRVCLKVQDRQGHSAEGWGETPLSVQWVWPSTLPYQYRHEKLKGFCVSLAEAWVSFSEFGHALEVGHDFQEAVLPGLLREANGHARDDDGIDADGEEMPWLAALVCCSAFDIALHDAYGQLHQRPTYDTYDAHFLNRDLSAFMTPAENSSVSFAGSYPEDFLLTAPPRQVTAWHSVGSSDPLHAGELTGHEPDDGYPVLLADWIERDGLRCLKIKLRGDDADWDYRRMVEIGRIAVEHGVDWLSADFNCTVREPVYVNTILDQLRDEEPRLFGMILYVEQPFPYDLEHNQMDVRSVAARKPLFLDESAHDWRSVKLGRELGWTGVALKTCKTQTGALLSCCWAKAHGMTLMVQDLTNPMLAQIPHLLLASHVGTIMGVETNAMQFYPDASKCEEAVHRGLYRRRGGQVDLSSVRGAGFGYRLSEIKRRLPAATAEFEVSS